MIATTGALEAVVRFGAGHVRGLDLFADRDGLVAEKLAYVEG